MNKWKRRWWSLALVMAGMALVLLLYRHTSDREPSYEGKQLRAWFLQYCRASSRYEHDETRREEAVFALRHMGTNALPYLLEQAFSTNQDSAFKTNLSAVLRALPRAWGFSPFIKAEDRRIESGHVIHDLKPPAHALLPALTNFLSHSSDPGDPSYHAALFLSGCVGSGGEAAVPYLVRALQQRSGWASGLAAQSLQWLGPQAKAAVPAMIAALPDPFCTHPLIDALGALGPDARAAIPALQKFLTHTNQANRLQAAVALCRIDPGQTAAVAVLREAIQDQNDVYSRKTAAQAMQKFERDDTALAPELVVAAKDPNDTVAPEALIALQKISPDLAQPLIHEQLHRFGTNIQLWAAERLLELDPNQPEALAILLQDLGDNFWRIYAMDCLGRAGPNTQKAKAPLQKLADEDPAPGIRVSAQNAIKRIERRDRNAKTQYWFLDESSLGTN